MSARPQHIHGAHAAAILRGGQMGIVATAFTNNAAALEFWKGYTEAARDLINGVGALAATKDELTGNDAQTSLQAAGACLPKRTKDLTLTQVRQFLAAQGIEVATNTIPHADLSAGEVLKHGVIPRVDGDDEHPVARVHVCHCSDSHGFCSSNQGQASLDHRTPEQDPAPQVPPRTSAAVQHILRQMQRDARLAWLIGPGSRTYELLTEEAATANGLDLEKLRQQHEATLKFEPWPTDLRVETDPKTILLDAPEPQPLYWYEERDKYSANGHIVWRNSVGRFAHYWEGFETRKTVLGGEEWSGSYHYYVPDNFGDLVEVPTP